MNTATLGKNQRLIAANGSQRLQVDRSPKGNMTLVVEWVSRHIPPAGILTFSVDGDPGENNVKDLSGPSRIWVTNGRPPYFDLEVSGLPKGGAFLLYVW